MSATTTVTIGDLGGFLILAAAVIFLVAVFVTTRWNLVALGLGVLSVGLLLST